MKSPNDPAGALRPRLFFGLTGPQLAIFGGLILAINWPLLHCLLRPAAEVTILSLPFADDFEREELGRNYHATGGHWRIVGGELLSPGVKNNPLWLKAALPENVRIEFDVRSESTEGDIKCEVFGDGYDHQSGYVLIHGGWMNTISVLARLDEHGPALPALLAKVDRGEARVGPRTKYRIERREPRVERGRRYHWTIERQGNALRWLIDGELFIDLDDKFPLKGKGHDRFGFSSWEADLYFDNLIVTPL